MKIILLNRFRDWPDGATVNYPCVSLARNTWNDYGYETRFVAAIHFSEENEFRIGEVKIGKQGYKSSDPAMRTILLSEQERLGEEFFSLGQSMAYYENLEAMEDEIRAEYAEAMRDIVFLNIPRDDLEKEEVFRVSLLRGSFAREALDKASHLFGGAERRVEAFSFYARLPGAAGPHRIDFDFSENRGLPHRINVLVGLNGVGKTQLMARLAALLSSYEEEQTVVDRDKGETLETLGQLVPMPSLYGVIAVSFSAFDDFELPTPKDVEKFRYVYCGLRSKTGLDFAKDKLSSRIPNTIKKMSNDRRNVLKEALKIVIPNYDYGEGSLSLPNKFYKYLSAGQRIVLNIITDLVMHIDSRTLLLLDEPETHLHPQLMSTLLHVVSKLLEEFDSFAVIATHSPIIVQQITSDRVHIIRRISGKHPAVSNPIIETFGENLTEITRAVFDAMESDRDYEEIIDQLLAANNDDVERVMRLFEKGLGLNAQIYLQSRGRPE